MDLDSVTMLAGALIALPAIGAAIGLGMYTSAYAAGVARNPEAKPQMDEKFFIVLAFIEALGIIPIGIGAALLFG